MRRKRKWKSSEDHTRERLNKRKEDDGVRVAQTAQGLRFQQVFFLLGLVTTEEGDRKAIALAG